MFYSLQLGLAASFKDLNLSALSKIGMYYCLRQRGPGQ